MAGNAAWTASQEQLAKAKAAIRVMAGFIGVESNRGSKGIGSLRRVQNIFRIACKLKPNLVVGCCPAHLRIVIVFMIPLTSNALSCLQAALRETQLNYSCEFSR